MTCINRVDGRSQTLSAAAVTPPAKRYSTSRRQLPEARKPLAVSSEDRCSTTSKRTGPALPARPLAARFPRESDSR